MFLCALRSVTVFLHLVTCFLHIAFSPSVFVSFFLLIEDSLVQYKAAIGLFNCFRFVSCFIVFVLVLTSSISMLLLISGSVHPNPEPSSVNFSIAHLNARSLNVSEKPGEISVLASVYGFDVFAYSKTWLNFSMANDSIVIPGYNYPTRKDRVDKHGGGVAIYGKDHIAVKRR